MVDLVAKSPCADLLPLRIGKLSATEPELGYLTLLMPFDGQQAALAEALELTYGLDVPGSGEMCEQVGARAIWFGRGQVLLAGPAPEPGLGRIAAVVDQSDAWACVELAGPGASDALARLCPIDLRPSVFAPGHTARTLIGHMSGSVTALATDQFLLMVFRSMAHTLVHDLTLAMETVAALD